MKLYQTTINLFSEFTKKLGIIITPVNKPYIPWPTAFSTVDVAIVDPSVSAILLGRKGNKWCIIGGFTDPSSASDEEDACRELMEETGIVAEASSLRYIGNFKVLDDRYAGTIHGVRTHFYFLEANSSNLKAKGSDDIDEVKWFSLKYGIIENVIQDCHKPLITALKQFLGNEYATKT